MSVRLQGKSCLCRVRDAQGASISNLKLLGQSCALALPSEGMIGVWSQQLGQMLHLCPCCLPWHQVVTLPCWCDPCATAAGFAGTALWGRSRRCLGVSQHWRGKDQEPPSLPRWSRAVVLFPVFLPPLPSQQKAQDLCRQEEAGCQQPPRTNDFGSWQQPCPYLAFHASGTAELRHVVAQLRSMGE